MITAVKKKTTKLIRYVERHHIIILLDCDEIHEKLDFHAIKGLEWE